MSKKASEKMSVPWPCYTNSVICGMLRFLAKAPDGPEGGLACRANLKKDDPAIRAAVAAMVLPGAADSSARETRMAPPCTSMPQM